MVANNALDDTFFEQQRRSNWYDSYFASDMYAISTSKLLSPKAGRFCGHLGGDARPASLALLLALGLASTAAGRTKVDDEPVVVGEASPKRSRGFLASLATSFLAVWDAVPALFSCSRTRQTGCSVLQSRCRSVTQGNNTHKAGSPACMTVHLPRTATCEYLAAWAKKKLRKRFRRETDALRYFCACCCQ